MDPYKSISDDSISVFCKLTAKYAVIIDDELMKSVIIDEELKNNNNDKISLSSLLIRYSNIGLNVNLSKFMKFKNHECLLQGLGISEEESENMFISGYYELILGVYFGDLSEGDNFQNLTGDNFQNLTGVNFQNLTGVNFQNLIEACDIVDFANALKIFENAVFCHIYLNYEQENLPLPAYYGEYIEKQLMIESYMIEPSSDSVTMFNLFWTQIHDKKMPYSEIESFYSFLENLAIISDSKECCNILDNKESCNISCHNSIFYDMSALPTCLFSLTNKDVYNDLQFYTATKIVPITVVFSLSSWKFIELIIKYLYDPNFVNNSENNVLSIDFYQNRVISFVIFQSYTYEFMCRDPFSPVKFDITIPNKMIVLCFNDIISRTFNSIISQNSSKSAHLFFSMVQLICGPLPQLMINFTSNTIKVTFDFVPSIMEENANLEQILKQTITFIGVGDFLHYLFGMNTIYKKLFGNTKITTQTGVSRLSAQIDNLQKAFFQRIFSKISFVKYYKRYSEEDNSLINKCTSGPQEHDIQNTCSVCFEEKDELYRFCLGDTERRINCACYMCYNCITSVNMYRQKSDISCAFCRRIINRSKPSIADLYDISKNRDIFNQTSVRDLFEEYDS